MAKRLYFLLPLFFLFSFSSLLAQNDVVDTILKQSVEPAEAEEQVESSFAPIKGTPTISTQKIPDDKVQALKNNDDYWYANQEQKKEEQPVSSGSSSRGIFPTAGWFQTLMWILVIGSLVAVISWYLGVSNIGLFRKPSKDILTGQEEETIEEDIFSIQYEKEIEKAVSTENYRLAVRLWYLFTLKELSQRHLIQYEAQKTNSEYVMKLFGSRYYTQFFQLTRNFNYVWYGQFPLGSEDYRLLQTDFQQFKSGLA